VVPAGAVFDVEILAEAIADRELGWLLNLLDLYAENQKALRLGALTHRGFGAMHWRQGPVTGLRTEADLRDWLSGDQAGFQGFPELSDEVIRSCRDRMPAPAASVNRRLVATLRIAFDGPFLINDPSQSFKSPKKNEPGLSHAYLKDEDGRPALSATSLQGALRSQAERIVRTVHPKDQHPRRACLVSSRHKADACPEVKTPADKGRLCLTCRLFGAAGWGSPLKWGRFEQIHPEGAQECEQELVAIDRFTGGAAGGAKFKVRYVYKPVFSGTLEIDLDRIEAPHAGLLILAFRDFLEGDVTLGFGRAKGFGACRVEITDLVFPEVSIDWLDGLDTTDWQNAWRDENSPLREKLGRLVECCRKKD